MAAAARARAGLVLLLRAPDGARAPVEADVEAEVAARLPAAAAAHARRAAAERRSRADRAAYVVPAVGRDAQADGRLAAGGAGGEWVTEPRHLWMLARARADPQHKFGVLLSETEERGAQSCVATLKVKEWGFKPASIREWMFKIGSSFLRKRSAPLTFVVGPAFELVEPPDYEFLDHVVSAAFGPMLEAGAQLDPLPVANVLVQGDLRLRELGRPSGEPFSLASGILSSLASGNSSSMPSMPADVHSVVCE